MRRPWQPGTLNSIAAMKSLAHVGLDETLDNGITQELDCVVNALRSGQRLRGPRRFPGTPETGFQIKGKISHQGSKKFN